MASATRASRDVPAYYIGFTSPTIARTVRLRVLLVWDSEYPWDIRVEKVGTALREDGHQVTILARNKLGRSRHEAHGDFDITRVAAIHKGPGRLNAAYTFPAFFSPVWFAAMHRAAADADLIIVRDLPLAPLALVVARMRRVPVIFDMAECYPEMLRARWKYGELSPADLLVRNPLLADALERATTRRVDHTLVMVEESRDRLLTLGVPGDRITIVSNTPVLSRFAGPAPGPGTPGRLGLVYIGLLGPTRGLVELVEGVVAFAAEYPGVHLTIHGSGKLERRLADLVRQLGAERTVTLAGHLDNTDLPRVLREADVGVIPHRLCGHWNHTVPNKLFDYMASALPVLATDALPVRRIVEQTGSGLIWRDGDRPGLLAALRQLTDPEVRAGLGHRGRRSVEVEFNWGRDAAALRRVVRTLAARGEK